MGNEDILLVAGNYPHTLIQHIKLLIKKKGRSILWGGSFVQLFEDEFPDLVDETFILEAAYSLGIPRRFQEADKQADSSKRVCIKQALFLLVQCMKEYEAAMFVESFMFLLGWDLEVLVERKWEVEEEDKANFHQALEKGAMGRAESQEHVEQKDGHTEAAGAKEEGAENTGKNSSKLARTAAERRQRRRAADSDKNREEKKEKEKKKKVSAKQSGVLENAEKTTVQVDPNRDVMFLAQMNLGMRRELKWAKKGNADSQQKLGGFYAEEGTKHLDYKEAVYWYKLSAAQGNYKAQLELGRIFDSGKIQEEGIKSTGIYWYRRLAEEGFPTAQCILGAKYLWGDGVEEDKKEAVRWLKKAAEQGHEEAKGYLAGVFNLR